MRYLLTITMAKPRENAEAILKTCEELFTDADIALLITVPKIATPWPRLWVAFFINVYFCYQYIFIHMMYRKYTGIIIHIIIRLLIQSSFYRHHHHHELWRVRRSSCSLALKVKLVPSPFSGTSYISPPLRYILQCLFRYPVCVRSLWMLQPLLLVLFYFPNSVLHAKFVPNGLIPLPIKFSNC